MSSNINLPIYMDYASTTPVDPRVAKKISDHLTLMEILETLLHALTSLVGKQKRRLKKPM